jgi:phosphate transport system substrate-binding protein
MKTCTQATITVASQDSAFGVTQEEKAVANNSASAGSTIAMYDGGTTLGPKLVPHPVGVLIYAVVAHKGLFTGSDVTYPDLVKIFVNHGDPSKVVVGRQSGSATHLNFFAFLHAKTGVADHIENDSAGVISFVGKTQNAVGYAVALRINPQVSLLSIDNVQPSRADVLSGSYKFWAAEHIYTAPQPTALATDFLAFLPHYIESHPQGYFITCSDATGLAGTDCPR